MFKKKKIVSNNLIHFYEFFFIRNPHFRDRNVNVRRRQKTIRKYDFKPYFESIVKIQKPTFNSI